MKLQQAVEQFEFALRGEIADSTLTWYGHHLRDLCTRLGNVDIEEVTIQDLRKYRASLFDQQALWEDHPIRGPVERGLSRHTILGRVRSCKRFFKWLVTEGYLPENPAARLRPPRLPKEPPKAISDEDLQALLDVADNPRDYALIQVLADTGARVGGIAGLRLEDVDLGKGTLMVREKGERSRVVYLTNTPLEALKAWLRERGELETDAVFPSRTGESGLTTSGIYQILKRLAHKAGIEGRYNPHAFRHGAARSMLENGADLATVSQILGHSSVLVTAAFYARWTKRELQERHRRYSRMRNLRGPKEED